MRALEKARGRPEGISGLPTGAQDLEVFEGGEAGGTSLAYDDDGGGGYSSLLRFVAPRQGRYTVRAADLPRLPHAGPAPLDDSLLTALLGEALQRRPEPPVVTRSLSP